MSELAQQLSILLADTYALYLKTQNYHWHVHGVQFKSLHELFDAQYHELADAVDGIAERLRIMGHPAPATFKEYERLKTIEDGDSSLDANHMVRQLVHDHAVLIKDLNQAILSAQKLADEGTVNLLADRIEAHQKAHWMLSASCD